MRTPQIVMGTAVVVLVVLLFTSPRHWVPAYSASNERTVQGVVQDVQEFYCPISGDLGTHLCRFYQVGSLARSLQLAQCLPSSCANSSGLSRSLRRQSDKVPLCSVSPG